MAALIYSLCALTAIACTVLLWRGLTKAGVFRPSKLWPKFLAAPSHA